MKKYVLKRLLSLIPTIFIVSVVIFLLVHLTPGDPAAAMLGEDATAAEIAALHTQLGLDDPLVVQYFRWVGNCLRLDFGTSTAVVNKPVSEMIASHFQPTILLAIYSQLITILIAIPCGMLAAKKRGTIADYFVSVLSMLGISLPSFLMGLGMVLLFAVNLRVLPAAGYKNPFTDGFLPFLRYMTLPAVSLGFIHAGYMMRMTKASMLEVLGSDYIKMARSKGVREWKIVTKHTFRNALLTVITVVGQGFISALAGAAVVERLFNIPGMGSLMVDSIEKRDYQVIQAITLLIAMLNVFINLIIDLIYGLNGQTQAMLLDDIRTALACGVSGMDLYKLQIMPKSPLGQAIAKGNIKYEYNDRMLAEMFVTADSLLAEQGAKALSCCHWAMREDERSGYNTLVKSGANIITCGAACGGHMGMYNYMKTMDRSDYVKKATSGQYAVMGMGKHNENYLLLEKLSGQCDSGRFDFALLKQYSDADWEKLFSPLLEQWELLGLLYAVDGKYYFTAKGKYYYRQMDRVLLTAAECALYGKPGLMEQAGQKMMGIMKNMK